MKLKRLEIYGFKSFAERTVISFEDGITGIVGPNGSGKSNLSDAVRWVLGEQSAKALRGGKMEDIIFNGTEKRKRLGYCEVSLVFDNEDHALAIDFAEVMITRRAYRTGEGEYYINRSACRLRDIIDLFRDTGIGREGYSIIGQGRIDEILSQKSEDRRGVFEEAAGIVKYRSRKEESEKRLENMRANLARVQDIISELEGQMEPLAKASETARRYLSLRDELRGLECSAFVLRSRQSEKRIQEADALLAELHEAISREEQDIQKLTEQRDQANESVQLLDGQVNEAHESVLELTREKEAREGDLGVLRAEIAAIEKEVLSLGQEIDNAKARITALTADIRTNEENEVSLNGKLEALRGETEQEEARLAEAQKATQEAEEKLEAHKNEIIASMNRLSDVRTSEARLSTMRQELENRGTEAENHKNELLRVRSLLQEDLEEAQQELEEARTKETSCSENEQKIDAASHEVSEKLEKLRALVGETEKKKSETGSRLSMLKDMERDYTGYQQAVRQVLLHSRNNPQVHGVVASLMQVPKEYERAVEAALGGALQNVVTENEYVAKDLISFLKRENYGRATFLPITSVTGRTLNPQERGALGMKGCLGVASELVAYDGKYRGIMENLLGRTVIAEDLDSGIEIQKRCRHSFRLVTLEGDVMNVGGSMTGGSSTSRMTSLLSREREIKEHETRAQELAKQLEELTARIAKGEALRAELKKRHSDAYDAVHQAQIDVSIAGEHVRIAEQKQQEHEARIEENAQLTAQIAENLKQIESRLQGTRSTQQGEERNTDEMNRRTAELSDDLGGKRDRVDALREKVEDLHVRKAAGERDLSALVQDGTRMKKELRELSIQLGQKEETRGKRILDHQADTEKAAGDEADSSACAAKLEEAKTLLTQREELRQESQDRARRLTGEVDSLRETMNTDSDRCHKAEMVLDRTKNELAQMQQRIWEDYELTFAGAQEYLKEPFDLPAADKRTGEIRREIRAMGPVNVSAVEDYRACRERYEDLTGQRDDLLHAQDDLLGVIDRLQKQMEKQFLENFGKLQVYFNETFRRLFGGGQAQLKLMDEHDVLSCGIEIVAQPPGKRLQLLSLLSGGERALTAIAILFAMLRLKPTPFCFLDEIEAALDDGNISTFADYLRGFSENTQFVVVTHRKGTMERCDSLYGVAMEEKGVTRMVSVELKDVSAESMA